jgi:hypothetical protein
VSSVLRPVKHSTLFILSLSCPYFYLQSRHSVVRGVTRGWNIQGSSSGRAKRHVRPPKPSTPALRPTPRLMQWVLGSVPGRENLWGVNLTTYLHLGPRLKLGRVISALPTHALMPRTGKLHINLSLPLMNTDQCLKLIKKRVTFVYTQPHFLPVFPPVFIHIRSSRKTSLETNIQRFP